MGLLGSDLLDDQARQYIHDEAPQAGIHGKRLNNGAHEQHGEGVLLHQLLHHHRQHLRGVDIPLSKAQVGS